MFRLSRSLMRPSAQCLSDSLKTKMHVCKYATAPHPHSPSEPDQQSQLLPPQQNISGSDGHGHNRDSSTRGRADGKEAAWNTGGSGNGSGSSERGPLSWKSAALQLGLMTIAGGGLYYWYDQEKRQKATASSKVQSYGGVKIGGPFSLTDTMKRTVTEEDFKGKFAILYFGFTMCPDVCPTEMDKLTAAVNRIEKRYGSGIVQPVFISVDPKRDSPERIKAYLADFHPSFIGLTGTYDQIADVTKKFRVYWSKPDDSAGDDYVVDHSIIMYVLHPSGEFIDYYGKNLNADEVTQKLTAHIEKYMDSKK
ncbi:mitochondrial CIV assembly protein Sco1 [Andalucia godoyi]|uniref:Mitochondrial CIV assembly protein Sco1 n=1 Tax=Andalucia godoyi TaxID=505711 RepID=A0A8K0F1B2_ANDGO|nr:mitochondrial CIV assembly protein Sco1 [Andalucia godoyi]|eukprot:ANDGO_03092.mRNA.1 mitochondrial CIV assembly protein Sco1